jgi:hypothetical protein
MATRLLDWTANAKTALWFAVQRPAHGQEDYGVVWMPPHIAQRISAQSGWFTVHANDATSPHGEFVPLELQREYLPSSCVHIEWQHSLLDDEP